MRSRGGFVVLLGLCSAAAMRPLRILALHGKGGTGATFRRGLGPLIDALGPGAEVRCPDAPLAGNAWWLPMPANARSYTADAFDGVDESLDSLVRCADGEPFDAIVGHSQGAMLAAVILAQRLDGDARARAILTATAPGVLSGAAWPKPFAALLLRAEASAVTAAAPTLHCVGAADDVNPPEMARRVAAVFSPTSRVFEHAGGHILPLDEDALREMTDLLRGAAARR
ncbi:serine hydrolase FSH [Pelagophyceae sp. CCMP2097]|nr:serine hydrolase FSH [Pelagophyceae sp. CCMP2097]